MYRAISIFELILSFQRQAVRFSFILIGITESFEVHWLHQNCRDRVPCEELVYGASHSTCHRIYPPSRTSCNWLFPGQVTSTGSSAPNTDGMEETVVDLCKMLLSYSAVCFQRSWGLNDRFKQLAPSFRKRLLKTFSSTGQGDVATDMSKISPSSVAMATVAITGRRGELAFLDCMKEESEDYECVKKRVNISLRHHHTGNACTQLSQAV